MERVRFIEHQGRRILLFDFSDIWSMAEGVKVIDGAREYVAMLPKKGDLLTLVDVKESAFDDRVVDKLKELGAHNRPWVLAGAVVGMSGMQKIMFRLINSFNGRKLTAFNTREQAQEWLVHQDAPPETVPET
ncbi:MAG TPA: hypothetical protein VLW85_08455 [Myxococcales bacterium]|nr:hypothetical protein [Myxococcales bacterium]